MALSNNKITNKIILNFVSIEIIKIKAHIFVLSEIKWIQ
jgi:hypothetical protein